MITGNKPIYQKDMEPTCLDKVILPLAGGHSPFWNWHWDMGKDCHNRFLLDALLKRVYRYLDITPEKHSGEEATIVTVVDRIKTRKIRNLDVLVAGAQQRWPDVAFQLVDLTGMPPKQHVLLARSTDVWVGVTGAAMTHLLWLPEESSVAEIQPPNKRMPDGTPYVGFRNLSKMRNLHYFTAHPERRPEEEGDWQMGEWLDVKPEVFNALVDAAIYAQLHRGAKSLGEVLPI
ncbi:EGF domain-specific O-linked N-acetylglucosamine transferase [Lachnellula occidentalis]|uniref:EGF domain-specific O-linked N-acetylglucosamine transferase n=1 Tax=Lachnellula occidentalis TaxID=215460 RepID=A0A8H8RPV1_9HELO|nr:EGF domain-specific O-linked N-acetylglucosamine transferase [Lachnellula occidentalis]